MNGLAARRDLHDRSDAVVLGLVNEVRILEGGVDERRQHRLQHQAAWLRLRPLRAVALTLFRRPVPACPRLRRSRSIKLTTLASRGSSPWSKVTGLPLTLLWIRRIRLSRYTSVYFVGSQSAARLLTSV